MTTENVLIHELNRINDLIENDEVMSHNQKLIEIEKIYDQLDESEDGVLVCRTLTNYANELLYIGETDQALKVVLRSAKLIQNLDDNDVKMKIFNCLGNIHSQCGRFALALDYYHQALRLTQHDQHKIHFQGGVFNNIAIMYSLMGMKEKAFSYFKEAFQISLKEHNPKTQFLTSFNITDLLLDMERIDEADEYFEIMQEQLKTKQFNKYFQALWHIINAKKCRMRLEFEESSAHLDDALKYFLEDNDVIGINDVNLERVKLLREQGFMKEAFYICKEVIDEAEKVSDHETMRSALKEICKIAQFLPEQNESFLYFQKLIDFDDFMFNNLYEASIFQLMEKTEIEMNDKIHENTEKLFENMRFIHEVSKDISKEQDYDALIKLIINKLTSFIACDSIVIALYDQESKKVIRRTMYHEKKIMNTYDIELNNKSSLATWIIRNNQEVYTGVYSQLRLEDFESLNVNFPDLVVPYETVFYLPLINDNEIIGVFSLQKFERNGFSHYELDMIRVFSSYISIAITNALKTEQMKSLNRTLEQISRRDGLSGLLNRNALNEDVKKILNTVKLTKSRISTIMVDIDFFKEFNDKYGHLEGDMVIKKVSDIIFKEANLFSPYIYRYGGDEFLIIIPDLKIQLVKEIAEKMSSGVTGLQILNKDIGVNGIVTLSIGIATFDKMHDHLNEDDLLKNADVALYNAKRRGRNQIKSLKF